MHHSLRYPISGKLYCITCSCNCCVCLRFIIHVNPFVIHVPSVSMYVCVLILDGAVEYRSPQGRSSFASVYSSTGLPDSNTPLVALFVFVVSFLLLLFYFFRCCCCFAVVC